MEIKLLECWYEGEFYTEEFRAIPGYEGLYEISSFGRVKTLKYAGGDAERILSAGVDRGGYLLVCLHKGCVRTMKKVHRLVAIEFIPNPKNKRTVNHKKGNKRDNRFFVLEWATHSENHKEAYRLGLMCRQGIISGCAKLTEGQVLEIRIKAATNTFAAIALEYGMSSSHISMIVSRQRWAHL